MQLKLIFVEQPPLRVVIESDAPDNTEVRSESSQDIALATTNNCQQILPL